MEFVDLDSSNSDWFSMGEIIEWVIRRDDIKPDSLIILSDYYFNRLCEETKQCNYNKIIKIRHGHKCHDQEACKNTDYVYVVIHEELPYDKAVVYENFNIDDEGVFDDNFMKDVDVIISNIPEPEPEPEPVSFYEDNKNVVVGIVSVVISCLIIYGLLCL